MSIDKSISILIIAMLFGCHKSAPLPEVSPVAIIPNPQSMKEDSGFFVISPKMALVVENQQQEIIARHFVAHFGKYSGWEPEIKFDSAGSAINLWLNRDIPSEGYRLQVKNKGVTITAGDDAGFFYALQTLMQLLPPDFVLGESEGPWAIPAITIEDSPAFAWRGFMMDVSRHFFPKQQVKQVLDMMAALKLNRFHWHLTDDQGWRVEIKNYPKLTEIGAWRVDYTNYDETISNWWGRPPQQPGQKASYGGFYTQNDIREIVAYARERFIEIVPEIDMPGHAQATIAAYPEIGCVNAAPFVATGGVYKNNTYNPGKEETFQFIETMLGEVMDLFPYEYIHIGGDECNKEQWKIDPYAQKRIREEGLNNEEELQSYFIKRVEGIINDKGRKMIGWDEILQGGLAPNATVMSWRGEQGGIRAASAGHDVIMTPASYCYLDLKQGPDDLEPNLGYSHMFLKEAYQYQLIPDQLNRSQAKHILGTQANLWTESITDWGKLTYMTYPRIYAVAENAWTAEAQQDWDDFISRLYPHLRRLDYKDIRYATSAFNVNIRHRGLEDGMEFTLETEANGLDYYYTLDGTYPDTTDLIYRNPFTVREGVTVSARAFKQGTAVGQASQLTFPIHKGIDAQVTYLTPYLEYKDAAGDRALVDYNYASLTIADDNWQGFAANMEVLLKFDSAVEVSEVRLTNLRYTISGVYIPENYRVLGSVDGHTFNPLGSLDLFEASRTQGRNKVTSTISFNTQSVRALKIVANSPNPIPQGHHLAGQASKIYLDEIVVL